jgi:CSLREA domain-containing protein/uncharacterized repeat protein (TIGR01451 family)
VAAVALALLAGLAPSAAPLALASTTYSVSAADDLDDGACDGLHCSLREAITAANANPGADRIELSFNPFGSTTIVVDPELPTITEAVDIEVVSFGGPPPRVGLVAGTPGLATGLHLATGASSVRGLAIGGFDVGVLVGADADASRLEENAIGLDADWSSALPNGTGVVVEADGVAVGDGPLFPGDFDPHGNLIAENDGVGVRVAGTAVGVDIERNEIRDNGALGIDLDPSGVDVADPDDADDGPNGGQNAPVMTTAETVSGQFTTIAGTLDSAPNTTYRVDVYGSDSCDASGFGEGRDWFLTESATTDGSGHATWGIGTSTRFDAFVTATATAPDGSTSEFSNCLANTIVEHADLSVTIEDERDVVGEGEPIHYTIAVANGGPTTAENVVVTVDLPADATFGSARSGFAPYRACSLAGTTVECPIPFVSSGGFDQVEVELLAGLAGPAVGQVTVTSDQDDPDASDDQATVTTTVATATPATFTVNSPNDGNDGTCDAGHCSLREAMTAANANPGRDTIAFALPGSRLIQPGSLLPRLGGPVAIDGTTQPGFAGAPLVELAGTSVPGGYGLRVSGGDSEVRGLVINRWANVGVELTRWGDNVVAGNGFGVDPTGSVALANGTSISVASPDNRIGGTTPDDRNVIAGGSTGIRIGEGTAARNVVEGNFIGINAAGTAAIPLTTGVNIVDASDNVIGGSDPGAGNVISGGSQTGVALGWSSVGPIPADNRIEGNLIGLNAAGTAAVANGTGVRTQLAVLDLVIRDNTISGNLLDGIELFNGAADTIVAGNQIGTDATGTSPVPNGRHGIHTVSTSPRTVVGGTTPAEANVIAFNVQDGLFIESQTAVLGNSIHANGGLGIDRFPNGVSAPGFPRIPVLSSATTVGASTTVRGSLTGATGNTVHRIEVFANAVCDPSGNGEGDMFLGTTDVTTNGAGAATFEITVGAVADGTVVTATSTTGGQTSEFSPCATSGPPPDDSAAGSGAPGTTTTTDGEADGATAADPIETTVTVPATVVSPAAVSIGESATLGPPPSGFTFFGMQVEIEAPVADPSAPLVLVFELDATIVPAGETAESVFVTRNGAIVGDCTATDGTADPDPCVDDRTTEPDGDLRLTVLTSQASTWNFAAYDGTIFTVNTTSDADDGACDASHCSLREAILGANATAGNDLVRFSIAGPGPHVIAATGQLPAITESLAIDGTSEPDFVDRPVVVVSGAAAPGTADGLVIDAWNVSVFGLTLNGWGSNAIRVDSDVQNAIIRGSWIGPSADGTSDALHPSGTALAGVRIDGDNNLVGGTEPGLGNVISGNGNGIEVYGDGNVVVGNRIGTTPDGLAALQNWNVGVRISGGSNNRVGGYGEQRNVISGNYMGLDVLGAGGAEGNNEIANNLIGVAADGLTPLGNTIGGIEVNQSRDNRIGGQDAGMGNVIAANGGRGIIVFMADGTRIQGNRIGTDATGAADLGNTGYGIFLLNTTNTLVGGTVPGAANVIRHNQYQGISALGETTTGLTIRGNSIDDSGMLGIDLGGDGVTLNTVGGPVSGPNPPPAFRQYLPHLAEADSVAGTVAGSLTSQPGTYVVELFRSPSCDPSGHGEGGELLGAFELVVPGSAGTPTEPFSFAAGFAEGDVITATVTNELGATSEFSNCVVAAPPGPATYVVNTVDFAYDGVCSPIHCSLLEALVLSESDAFRDLVHFDIPGAGPHRIALPSDATLSQPIEIDGTTQPGWAGVPLIELDGSSAGDVDGWRLDGAGSLLRGVAIGGYAASNRAAVVLGGEGSAVESSWIGLAADGSAWPNYVGVHVRATGGRVGGPGAGNVISGNLNNGVQVGVGEFAEPISGVVIQGNRIGTDPSGESAVGNANIGIAVYRVPGTLVGGRDAGEGNLVSGNDQGIQVAGAETGGTTIEGNRIGTDEAGAAAVPNNVGVSVSFAEGVVIGGEQPGAGNLISGNSAHGIELGTSAEGTVIAGNRIGTTDDGASSLGNGQFGVFVGTGVAAEADQDNRIGVPGAGNLISGNGWAGIGIGFTSRPAPIIAANVIGLSADRSTAIPNGHGVWIGQGSTLSFVGTGDPADANVIAGNAANGVTVTQGATGAAIAINEIRDNGELAIDLGDDGPTPNDPGDVDDPPFGGNHAHNTPLIGAATVLPDRTSVTIRLDGLADLEHVVFVYANPSCDPSGFGEASQFLGSADLTTDAAGQAEIVLELPVVPTGAAITASAIGIFSAGSSLLDFVVDGSEMSACVTASPPAAPTPTGTNVQVQPVDAASGLNPVSLTFDTVSTAGETSLSLLSEGPAVPSGFQLGDPPLYFEVGTTATFDQATICVSYAGVSFADEGGLRLLHYDVDTGLWEDVTTSHDTVGDVICGRTDSFSPFAIVQRDLTFSGFFSPVNNLPTVNVAKAGTAIPLNFGLGGAFGLDVLATGFPVSQRITCDAGVPVDVIESTVAAGSSSLQYDPLTERYTYVWKTEKSWANTCRQITLTFVDGTTVSARFQFRK